jgi:aryl-alcohol dehydrogenase-like predicted oxidoreductase
MKNEKNKLKLPRLGLGCGSMVKTVNKDEYKAVIHTALDSGVTMLNTADFYGSGVSEMIIGEALKERKREDVFISLKFGALTAPNGQMYGLDVRPFNIKNYLAHSLKRLNLDYVDLFQPARIDLEIPVEETVGAISELVKEGYVRHIGMTQVDADTLKRADAVHPISLYEAEYSLFNREMEINILPTARELGIPVAAFGALAHGLLGGIWTEERIQKSIGGFVPLFFKENIRKNVELVNRLQKIADEKQITVSQLAFAWMLSKGEDIIPLIGASRTVTFLDSLKSLEVSLSTDDIMRIENTIPKDKIAGGSFPDMKFSNGKIFKQITE